MQTLIGGLLAAAGHEVAFPVQARRQPGAKSRRRLRVVLPGGWRAADVTLQAGGSGDLLVTDSPEDCARVQAVVVLLQGTMIGPEAGAAADARRVPAVPVMSVVQLEPGEVELASRRSCLILRENECEPVQTLAACLREAGIEVLFVRSIDGYADSWFLHRLLLLAPALCHSTLDRFLATAPGREISRHVLEEGTETLRRLGREPARLPLADPQELLERIRRGDKSLDGHRFAPGRELGEPLQAALRGEKVELGGLNERLVRLASQAGTDPRWNWQLARKKGRLHQRVFFRSAAELHEAIR